MTRSAFTKQPMKLIGTLTSPYVRKTRIVLIEKAIDYEFIVTDLNSPDNIVSHFNPLGKVLCLIMNDGKGLYDSSVIVDYLDTMTSINPLLPGNSTDRSWIKCQEALADGVMDAAILVRLESKRPSQRQDANWIHLQTGKIHSGLHALSSSLGKNTFCHGNTFSLADIALGCALGWLDFRFPKIEWRKEYENLSQLFDRLSARPSFIQTRPQ